MAKKKNKNQAEASINNKNGELSSRFMFLAGALIIFRAGTFIPVPGVDPAALAASFARCRFIRKSVVNDCRIKCLGTATHMIFASSFRRLPDLFDRHFGLLL